MDNLTKIQIAEFSLKAPVRISPSQFTRLQDCAYSVVLKESVEEPLLPSSAASFLGSIIHEILEAIAKGEIRGKQSFLKKWTALVLKKEDELQKNGLSGYIPLKRTVPYFALKKLQTLQHIQNDSNSRRALLNIDAKISSEKWLQSKDGKIVGVIDLIYKTDKTRIVDFKTGRIFKNEDSDVINPSYEKQLKLYAWLYFDATGEYPDELFLVDLQNHRHNIPFEPEECEELANEARQKLEELGLKVQKGSVSELASPAFATCQYCNYKPACPSYWEIEFPENIAFFDIKGVLSKAEKNQNDTFNLEIKDGQEKYYIINFQHLDYPVLKAIENQMIQIFNLGKTEFPGVFTTLKSTKVYAGTK